MSVKLQTTSGADPAIIIVTFLLESKFPWYKCISAVPQSWGFAISALLLSPPTTSSSLHLAFNPIKIFIPSSGVPYLPPWLTRHITGAGAALVRHQTARAGQLITRARGRAVETVWIGDPGAANFPLHSFSLFLECHRIGPDMIGGAPPGDRGGSHQSVCVRKVLPCLHL